MNVQSIMTGPAWTCRADESLAAAARLMWDHDIGAVPVLGGDGKLVGIVTDRDICMSAYFSGGALSSVAVSRAMSTKLFTARPGQTVQAAEELMRAKQIRRLPVVDDQGKLLGMVSLFDVARVAGRRNGLDAGEVVSTLAAIGKPRPPVTKTV